MQPSQYLMQIIDRRTGEVVQFEPGLTVEKAFVEDCVERAVDLGVGFGKTRKHVERVMRTAIEMAILDLKGQIKT